MNYSAKKQIFKSLVNAKGNAIKYAFIQLNYIEELIFRMELQEQRIQLQLELTSILFIMFYGKRDYSGFFR